MSAIYDDEHILFARTGDIDTWGMKVYHSPSL